MNIFILIILRIKKLESEIAQVTNQHKEFVSLRRENYEKNLTIQDNHVQITNMDAKIR